MPKAANRLIKTWSHAEPEDIVLGTIAAKVAKVAGPMIAMSPAQKLIDELKKKKATKITLQLMVDSDQLMLAAQGVSGAKKVAVRQTLIKKFGDHELRVGAVMNLQPDDETMNRATEKILARGEAVYRSPTSTSTLKGIKGEVIIKGHGTVEEGAQGTQTYAVELGRHTPDQVVQVLVKAKKLPKSYAGVIYLAGCSTGAGATAPKDAPQQIQNFAKQVYDKLVSLGYKKLQVKGNLGTARTTDEGAAVVRHAEEEPRLEAMERVAEQESDESRQRLERAWERLDHAAKQRERKAKVVQEARARSELLRRQIAERKEINSREYKRAEQQYELAKGLLQQTKDDLERWGERRDQATKALSEARRTGEGVEKAHEDLGRLLKEGEELRNRLSRAETGAKLAGQQALFALLRATPLSAPDDGRRQLEAAVKELNDAESELEEASEEESDATVEREEKHDAYMESMKEGYIEGLTGTFGPEKPAKR